MVVLIVLVRIEDHMGTSQTKHLVLLENYKLQIISTPIETQALHEGKRIPIHELFVSMS